MPDGLKIFKQLQGFSKVIIAWMKVESREWIFER
jgi:hypothetical protein